MNSFADPQFSLSPVADRVGPFPHGDYLATVWRHTCADEDLCVVGDGRGVVAFAINGESIRFVGSGDLVDYRSPLGEGTADLIGTAAGSFPKGHRIVLDSLPYEAAEIVAKGLESAGLATVVEEHAVTAVLALPDSFETYLEQLGKKERHETRRKRRRYEATLGEVRFVHESSPARLFEEFVALHRQAPGEKGTFMTEEMAAYFCDLAALDGWGVDALVDENDTMVAGGFAHQNEDGYFLYNSAFDPAHGEVSPGVVLIAGLVELAIERGARVFDFLKGDETYKFRLGAEARQLYVVTART